METPLKVHFPTEFADTITTSQQYPPNYNYKFSFSVPLYQKCKLGEILSQYITGSDYWMELLTISIKQDTYVDLLVKYPVICLAILLKGDVGNQILGRGHVNFPAGTYNVFYLPPGTHKITLLKDEYVVLYFVPPGSYLESISGEHKDLENLVRQLTNEGKNGAMLHHYQFPKRIMQMIRDLQYRNLKGGRLDLALRQCMNKILTLYYEQLTAAQPDLSAFNHQERIYRVRDYVLENLAESDLLSLDKVAKLFNTTSKTLTREFQKQFGKTIPKFRKEEQLKWAFRLLSKESSRVSEVALTVGFYKTSNFCREFKKLYKTSPGKVRANYKK